MVDCGEDVDPESRFTEHLKNTVADPLLQIIWRQLIRSRKARESFLSHQIWITQEQCCGWKKQITGWRFWASLKKKKKQGRVLSIQLELNGIHFCKHRLRQPNKSEVHTASATISFHFWISCKVCVMEIGIMEWISEDVSEHDEKVYCRFSKSMPSVVSRFCLHKDWEKEEKCILFFFFRETWQLSKGQKRKFLMKNRRQMDSDVCFYSSCYKLKTDISQRRGVDWDKKKVTGAVGSLFEYRQLSMSLVWQENHTLSQSLILQMTEKWC